MEGLISASLQHFEKTKVEAPMLLQSRLFHHEGHEEDLGGVVARPVDCPSGGQRTKRLIPSLESGDIAQLIPAFDDSSDYVLRVLRDLRREFPLTSGLAS